MNKRKGFTLVELLVVIAIIAVLAGALLIGINPQALIQKSRDSKRLQDLDSLNKALTIAIVEGEMLLADATGDSSGSQAVNGTGYVSYTVPVGKTGLSRYISTLPIDPLNTAPNLYYYASSVAGNYELNTILEHPDNLVKMQVDGGNDPARFEVGTALTLMSP
ncbi:MAG TPA: prepilin-type N-terminal cleavage/methylation domain-containing protein [bacterium]|nr:prepilin-type N-terminal cleavage/methylation domain-containing protein [bacterium]HOA18321.1 prepilin-type N-terminal cleavage/methylation domain-containing protein [bacterium]